MTVIKLVHITITSFYINAYGNKSYLIDVDPLPRNSADTPPQIQNHGKYTADAHTNRGADPRKKWGTKSRSD